MTHTDTAGLLPCPFCGGDKLRGQSGGAGPSKGRESRKFYEILCHECGARMRQPSKPPALVAWNRRADTAGSAK